VKEAILSLVKVQYVDIYTPMLDTQGKSRPDLFEEDMLHMLKAGYDIWKDVIKEIL